MFTADGIKYRVASSRFQAASRPQTDHALPSAPPVGLRPLYAAIRASSPHPDRPAPSAKGSLFDADRGSVWTPIDSRRC
jgi:hypothetical protein